MKRVAIIAAVALGAAVLATTVFASDDGSSGDYLVRAVFDNGSFAVSGEDVRVAGANVGQIEDVDVSLPGEVVSRKPGEEEQAGKAIVVLRIDNPAFQDFRTDASCVLRPQSLIGERYVNCRPTMPRSPDSEPPPSIEPIPDGERGAGQHLVPLESNSTSVDVDLVQNIQRRPYADRLRIILNELGIGFATRADDVAEIVQRADPTLHAINKVLAILAGQRKRLTRLAVHSERILEPLSKQRSHVTGFIRNAGQAAQATAERRADLELAISRFPAFLRELRSTMSDFEGFSKAALPVTQDLRVAAPSLTEATQNMAPFAKSSTIALTSFGDAAEAAGPKLAAADPIVRTARDLATSGKGTTANFQRFLRSTRRTGGFENLMKLIYNTNASMNGFDDLGHILRAAFVPSVCLNYVAGWSEGGCDARWFNGALRVGPEEFRYPDLVPGNTAPRTALQAGIAQLDDSTPPAAGALKAEPHEDGSGAEELEGASDSATSTDGSGAAGPGAGSRAGRAASARGGSYRSLLNYLMRP